MGLCVVVGVFSGRFHVSVLLSALLQAAVLGRIYVPVCVPLGGGGLFFQGQRAFHLSFWHFFGLEHLQPFSEMQSFPSGFSLSQYLPHSSDTGRNKENMSKPRGAVSQHVTGAPKPSVAVFMGSPLPRAVENTEVIKAVASAPGAFTA